MSIQNLFKSLISTSTRPVASRQPRSKSRMPRRSAYHPVLETLEDRTLLSTIVWTNRGSAVNDSDGFNGVFGGNAALARNVVDYSLLSWQSVITSFNYSDPKLNDTYRMTVNMQTSGVSLGASAGPTKNLGGKPTEGSASIGRGGDTNNDNIGDGAGWFLDPTPQEHSEFLGTINNAFSAQAQVGSPAAGLSDLYSIVLHEFGHALGFTRGSDYLLQKEGKETNTRSSDTDGSSINQTRDGGGNIVTTNPGFLWRFDGPSIRHLMTSYDSAPSDPTAPTLSKGTDSSFGSHSAAAGQTVTSNGITYVGADDLMNPRYAVGQRRIIPETMALILQDAYGYTINDPANWPNLAVTNSGVGAYGTSFYAALRRSDGRLLIRGGVGADVITVSSVGSSLLVTVDIGNDVAGTGSLPGTGNLPAFSAFFPTDSAINTIVIEADAGNDLIIVDGSLGHNVRVRGGSGTDTVQINASAGQSTLSSSEFNAGATHVIYGDFNETEALIIDGSKGQTQVSIDNTSPNVPTTVNGASTVNVLGMAQNAMLTIFKATNVYVQKTAANATVNIVNCVNVNVGGGNVSDIQSAVHVRPATGLIKKVATNLTVDFALDSTAQNIDIFDNVVVFQGKSIVDFLQNGLLTLTVNGGPGNGTGGNLFFVFSTPGVNALTLNTGTGKDIVQVIACSSPVTIRGQNGADTVQIGSDARGLEAVRATVNVNNQNGFTDLIINDKAGTQNHPNIVMHPGQILGIGSAINFAASDIRFLTVNTGSGVNTVKLFNTIRVRPLSAGGTTINTSGGPTNIYVSATTGPLNINLGGFSETVTLGAVGSSAGSLNSIQGAVFVHGSGRLNFLRIDDQANTVDRQYIVKGNSLSTTGVADISFDGIYDFTLAAGRGGDTIDVWDNPTVNNAFSGVALLAGGGNDTINLGALTHQLSSLRRLFVDGQGGVNTLVLHDEATAEAQTYQYVTPVNPLVGYPSVSSTGIVVPYANLARVNLYGGIGNDTVNVLGVPANVTANVDAGFGNDQVNVGADTLDKILGSVYVSDRQGIDFLDINDQGRAAPQTYTLTSVRRTLNYESRLRLGDGRSVGYFGINGITLNAGRGGNTIRIEGTPPDTQVLVNSGTGADTLSVGDAKNRLDSILGQINIEGQGGVDHLRFNDQGTTNGRNYSITANGLSRTDAALVLHSGMADVVINGSAGDDNFGEALTDADMPLTINGGGGSDFLASNAIPTTWRVTADNAGKINNNITFKSVENLFGSDEDDTFVFSKGASLAGSVTGARGVNTLDYSAFTTHVTVNLVLHAATGVGAGVYQIQNAVGGSGNDILVGDGGNVLKGGAGRDLLIAGALASTLDGGAENDLLLGGTTDYDHDDAALLAILAEWATNQTASLLNATTVSSNGGSNRLTGGDGLDLFFAKFEDELLDWDPLQETWVMLL